MSLIPYVVRPLHRLRVLVTRPEPHASRLAELVRAQGGEAVILPSIEIRAVPATVVAPDQYTWMVFLSVHAVQHSSSSLAVTRGPRIAAIGKATTAGLKAAGWDVHVVPQPLQTTEALLATDGFTVAAGDRVLIVRGAGSRDALDLALNERGARVDSLIVYERVPIVHPPEQIATLEQDWAEGGIDVVTATSAETLVQLHDHLTERGRDLLARTAIAVVSPRVATRAHELGLTGECIITGNADDDTVVGAIGTWAARAR